MGIIKCKCQQCLYHQLLFYEIFRDKRQIYFPKEWVAWEDYMRGSVHPDFSKQDIQELLKTEVFSETEKFFMNFALRGYSSTEIVELTGYGERHVHMTFQKIYGRLKNAKEVHIKAPKKWGRIGSYKNAKRNKNG